MRKIINKLLLVLLFLVPVGLVLASCGIGTEEHTHTYDQKSTDSKYLASEATCTSKAKYYYSCSCGEKGTDTFEYGEVNPNNHNYGKWTSNGDGTHSKVCSYDSSHSETESCSGGEATTTKKAVCEVCGDEYGDLHTHTYDQENIDSKYLVSAATCTSKAKYYYSCSCGEKSTETFEYGDVDLSNHTGTLEWIITSSTHQQKYNCCDTLVGEAESHNFVDNVCSSCGKQEYSVGLEYTLLSDESGYEVTGIGSCTDTNIIIPPTYNNLPVLSIGKQAFYGELTPRSIVIPEGVTSIGEKAISNCFRLVSITIPSSVTSIGDSAFYLNYKMIEVYNLSSFEISVGAEEENGYAGYYALDVYTSTESSSKLHTTSDGYIFYENGDTVYLVGYVGSDTSLTLPDNYNNKKYGLYQYVFYYHTKTIKSITISTGVTSIGNYAFGKCYSATSITIPSSVTSIGGWAFAYCTSLTSITIPNSVTSIEYDAFYKCEALTSVTILENVTSIGDSAFSGCTSLTSITIPNSVTSIGYSAFKSCASLTSVIMSDSLTSIGSQTFSGCISLTSITIPSGVTSIGNGAFSNCYKLVEVYNLSSSLTITTGSTSNGSVGYYAKDVYTSTDSTSKLTTTEDGYIFYEDGDTVYLIGYTGSSTTLTLPDKYNNKNYSIYKYAFYGSLVKSLIMPSTITEIGTSAFEESSIVDLYYNGTIENWCNITFTKSNSNPMYSATHFHLLNTSTNDYDEITELVIPSTVTAIGKYQFYGFRNIIKVTIPSTISSIGSSAFSNCYKLVEVYNLSSSLTITAGKTTNGSVGKYALNVYTSSSGSSKLTTTSDGYVFYEDSDTVYLVGYTGSSTSLTLPDKYNSKNYCIYQYALSRQREISSITIPNSVTGIGEYAFLRCTSLNSVTIGSGVESIGNYAFYNCTSLTSITIPSAVTSIGKYTFYNCSKLQSITIPSSVTSIGTYAFYGCSSLTNVYYTGSSSDWSSISIASYNTTIKSATITYDYAG